MSFVERRLPPLMLFTALLVGGMTALTAPAAAQPAGCSGQGSAVGESVNAGGGCPGPPPSSDPDDDDAQVAPVRNTVECTDELRNNRDAWFIAYDADWERVDGYAESQLLMSDREDGQVVGILRDCAGEDRGSPFWTDPPPEGEADGFDQLLDARDRAFAHLDLSRPDPRIAPDGNVLVGMPAWLWLDDEWRARVETDATPGGISVSVFAEPNQLTWATPEGDRVCDGPGIPWSATAWDEYQATAASTRGQGNPACTFVFENASHDGAYATSVTVTWSVGWSFNDGPRQQLPALELTSEVPVDVGEVRAVRTR